MQSWLGKVEVLYIYQQEVFMQNTKIIQVPVEQEVEQVFNDLNLNIVSAIQEFLREIAERNVARKIQKKFPSISKPVHLGFDFRKISREELYER